MSLTGSWSECPCRTIQGKGLHSEDEAMGDVAAEPASNTCSLNTRARRGRRIRDRGGGDTSVVKPGRAANTPESVHFPSMVCGEGDAWKARVPCWRGTRERGQSWPRGWACCLPRAVRGLRRGLTRLVHLRVCGEPRPGRCPSWRSPPAPAHLLILLSEEIGILAQREG